MTNSPNTIVVGYDGSAVAGLAVTWAMGTAAGRHVPLRVVVAGMDPAELPARVREWDEHLTQSAAAAARDLVKTDDATAPETAVQIVRGEALPVLREAARDAALLVVGSHGHGPVEGRWLGSVSQHLAGHAPSPAVVIVRPPHNPQSRQIIVGIDGSASSRRALDFACERAAVTGESVLVVHAYTGIEATGAGLAGMPSESGAAAIEDAEQVAGDVVADASRDHPEVELRSTAAYGRAGRVLSRLSDDASLLVVGSRGRTSVVELVIGSVAQAVLHWASCPVAVVR